MERASASSSRLLDFLYPCQSIHTASREKRREGGTKERAGSTAETQGKRETKQEKCCVCGDFFAMMQENFYYNLQTLTSVLGKHVQSWP